MKDSELYARAGRIIDIAMGKEEGRGPGRKRRRAADLDPLAYWSGVQAIVDLVDKAFASRQQSEVHQPQVPE